MSIYSIKYKSNEQVSDKSTIQLYLISGAIFVVLASIPSMIF